MIAKVNLLKVVTLFCVLCSLGVQAATPTVVSGLGNYSVSFALSADGSLWTVPASGYPSTVTGLPKIIAVSSGHAHTLALGEDGTVWAWGWGYYGQLGRGSTDTATVPIQVQGLGNITAIAAGAEFSLALASDGTVWTWGRNIYGQLGRDAVGDGLLPGLVPGLSNIISVSSGTNHAFAIDQDGNPWAWGYNYYGQLGDGSRNNVLHPMRLQGLTGIHAIVASYDHSVALRSDSTVWAWGSNDQGQLGNGSVTSSLKPTRVILPDGVIKIAAGDKHGMAVLANGKVWVWGSNSDGQLGVQVTPLCSVYDFTLVFRKISCSPTPVQLNDFGQVAEISAGVRDSMAVQTDGTVSFWGSKSTGIGIITPLGATPTQVKAGLGVVFNLGGNSQASDTQASERIFNWAEATYPNYFAPGAGTRVLTSYLGMSVLRNYLFRYYESTGNYLGVSDRRVFLHNGRDWFLLDVGSIDDFLPIAMSAGY